MMTGGITSYSTYNQELLSSKDFAQTLKLKVENYLSTNTPLSAPIMPPLTIQRTKGFILAFIILAIYSVIVFENLSVFGTVSLGIFFGIAVSIFGLNVMHEASHNNLSNNSQINRLIQYSMDFFGVSSAIYRIKHNIYHHHFTNISGLDGDISETPLIRMSPQQAYWKIHRIQAYYAPFLYSLLTVTWIFDDLIRLITKRIGSSSMPPIKRSDMIHLFLFKLIHALVFIGVPSLFHPFWKVIGIYLLAQMTLGFILAFIFQAAHLFQGAKFPTQKPKSESDWMIHQIETTSDFATDNKIVNFVFGGLNFQVEHHLFPNISCTHYPQIHLIVKETCREFGIRFNLFPTLSSAFASHLKLLNTLGVSTKESL